MNAIDLICKLHTRDGATPIGKMPDPWHRKLADGWEIWVNGQMKPATIALRGIEIGPGDCYAEFNGWPAGIFSMITGEGTLAAGSAANYETFCEAIKNAPREVE